MDLTVHFVNLFAVVGEFCRFNEIQFSKQLPWLVVFYKITISHKIPGNLKCTISIYLIY